MIAELGILTLNLKALDLVDLSLLVQKQQRATPSQSEEIHLNT